MPSRHLGPSFALAMLRYLAVVIISISPLHAQTLNTLYTFAGGLDGGYSKSTLALDGAGNLFGTTTAAGLYGNGTLFKIDTSSNFSVVHAFGIGEGHPVAGVVVDPAGNLYGTTYQGGPSRPRDCLQDRFCRQFCCSSQLRRNHGQQSIGVLGSRFCRELIWHHVCRRSLGRWNRVRDRYLQQFFGYP